MAGVIPESLKNKATEGASKEGSVADDSLQEPGDTNSLLNNLSEVFEELSYKFKDLSSLQPDNVRSKTTLFDNPIKDELVHNYSPEKYAFYMQFLKTLKNPDVLKNVIYENKLIKANKEDEDKMIRDIVTKLEQLYAIHNDGILENDNAYKQFKEKKIYGENQELANRLGKILVNEYGNAVKEKIKSNIKDTFGADPTTISGGAAFSDEAKANEILDMLNTKFKDKSILRKYTEQLKNILDAPTGDDKLKAQKLKDILIEIENDDIVNINVLQLSKEDKLVFLGITFMVRLVTLMIIDWALTSNFIVTFTEAYTLYIGIYTVIVLLFVVIVNITYNMSVFDLYSGEGIFTSFASSMYYFYLVPGNMFPTISRIGWHLFIIFAITLLALFITGNTKTKDEIISFDYSEKRKIRATLSNYTLILWMITSVIAFGMK